MSKRIRTQQWIAEQRLRTRQRPLFKNGTPPKRDGLAEAIRAVEQAERDRALLSVIGPIAREQHCTHPGKSWCDCDWCRVVRA